MEVKIEDNPLIHRIWNEWMERDRELSNMTKEERLEFVSRFQWVFPKKTKRMVELEALYSSVHYRHNREEFRKWATLPAPASNPRRRSTWFFISEMRGDITMAVPSIRRAGSW